VAFAAEIGFGRAVGRVAGAEPGCRRLVLAGPDDILFIDDSVYAWRAKDEYAVAAYWVGRYGEALTVNEGLLAGGKLPPAERARVENNVAFCRERLGPR
jgi:hypothetical protein